MICTHLTAVGTGQFWFRLCYCFCCFNPGNFVTELAFVSVHSSVYFLLQKKKKNANLQELFGSATVSLVSRKEELWYGHVRQSNVAL